MKQGEPAVPAGSQRRRIRQLQQRMRREERALLRELSSRTPRPWPVRSDDPPPRID